MWYFQYHFVKKKSTLDVWLVQFLEFLAYITVALVYNTRLSKLYVWSEYKMHTKSFGAMVLRTSNQPFWFVFNQKISSCTHRSRKCMWSYREGKAQSCPWLSDRHKQRGCISYEFLDQVSVRIWYKLVCSRSVINLAHNSLCQ